MPTVKSVSIYDAVVSNPTRSAKERLTGWINCSTFLYVWEVMRLSILRKKGLGFVARCVKGAGKSSVSLIQMATKLNVLVFATGDNTVASVATRPPSTYRPGGHDHKCYPQEGSCQRPLVDLTNIIFRTKHKGTQRNTKIFVYIIKPWTYRFNQSKRRYLEESSETKPLSSTKILLFCHCRHSSPRRLGVSPSYRGSQFLHCLRTVSMINLWSGYNLPQKSVKY